MRFTRLPGRPVLMRPGRDSISPGVVSWPKSAAERRKRAPFGPETPSWGRAGPQGAHRTAPPVRGSPVGRSPPECHNRQAVGTGPARIGRRMSRIRRSCGRAHAGRRRAPEPLPPGSRSRPGAPVDCGIVNSSPARNTPCVPQLFAGGGRAAPGHRGARRKEPRDGPDRGRTCASRTRTKSAAEGWHGAQPKGPIRSPR